jgi:glutamate synthase domain-containing protein 1
LRLHTFNNSVLAGCGNLFAQLSAGCTGLPAVATFTSNMCGIVGYVGRSQAAPILLDGLRRLEYRGYDSAGVAIVNGNHVETRKCAGRIASLAKLISQKPAAGS